MCHGNNEKRQAVALDTVGRGDLFEEAHQSMFFGLQVTKTNSNQLKDGRKERRKKGRQAGG